MPTTYRHRLQKQCTELKKNKYHKELCNGTTDSLERIVENAMRQRVGMNMLRSARGGRVAAPVRRAVPPVRAAPVRAVPVVPPVRAAPVRAVPVAMRASADLTFNPSRLIKMDHGVRRLSAGEYYRKWKEPAINTRCNIRQDGDYKCAVKKRNGVVFWGGCKDNAPRCLEEDFI